MPHYSYCVISVANISSSTPRSEIERALSYTGKIRDCVRDSSRALVEFYRCVQEVWKHVHIQMLASPASSTLLLKLSTVKGRTPCAIMMQPELTIS